MKIFIILSVFLALSIAENDNMTPPKRNDVQHRLEDMASSIKELKQNTATSINELKQTTTTSINELKRTTATSINELKEKMLGIESHISGERNWKLQGVNVCFGARDNSYGKVYLTNEGILQAFKLVYKSGYVSCYHPVRSHWGCDSKDREIRVIITDEANIRVFPKSVQLIQGCSYYLAGFHSMKNELAFTDFLSPMYGMKGQEIRIWYSEDLVDGTEEDNSGQTCADVYAKFY